MHMIEPGDEKYFAAHFFNISNQCLLVLFAHLVDFECVKSSVKE